jgi:hypothetical protein
MALTKVDISLMQNTGTTANKLLVNDGSGNLPAVDGSQLINPNTGVTNSASDPTISTNPSGGVGTEWHNTTSGEVYICTDATAGENVWTNVGAGTGDVEPFQGWGSNYGYMSLGASGGAMDKFSFASGTQNGTSTLALSVTRGTSGSSSSSTYGHRHGGYTGSSDTNVIDRFSFSSESTATDWGDLSRVIRHCGGTMSTTHGYRHGGYYPDTQSVDIEKYTFASSAAIDDVGDLVIGQYYPASTMSNTNGYSLGGQPASGANHNQIQRYSFSTDGNATDVSNMSTGHTAASGSNSSTHGYCAGGDGGGSGTTTVIDKFSFASDSSGGSNIGTLTVARNPMGGTSSKTHGYSAGGSSSNVIDKYSFSSDGNATDVGNLSSSTTSWGGNQV